MKTIYGIHDPGGEHLMLQAGQPGWVVVTEAIGSNPNDRSGADYRYLSDQGLGVIVRLNNGYKPAGTLPHRSLYESFAQRCANFVEASAGADRYILGNEPNHSQEWPDGVTITANDYSRAFQLAYTAIKARRREAQVLTAAVAPWNVEAGDWLAYFAEIMRLTSGGDGICLHAYSHGAYPGLITSEARMDPPFEDRRYEFRAYRDFLARLPDNVPELPIHITEADQYQAWIDQNTGWVQAAYAEIDAWNRTAATNHIHCLCLYRWPKGLDKWGFEHKPGVIEDFKAALQHGYAAPAASQPADEPSAANADGGFSTHFPLIAGGGGGEPPSPATPPEREWDERLTRRKVELTPHKPQPGETYWRLIRAEYWEEKEHIFVETLDEAGNRLPGVTVRRWNGDDEDKRTEPKPNDRWMLDYPMYAAGRAYGVRVLDGPSDEVFGMGLGSVDAPDMGIHVSYKLVFQRTEHGGDADMPDESQQAPAQPAPRPAPEQPIPAGIIDPVTAMAFLQVESGNLAFTDGLLTIRVEIHRLQVHLQDDALFDRHFTFTPGNYGEQFWRPAPDAAWRHAHGAMAGRHELLTFARSLDDTAALLSTGMGMAQIMGSNARRVGYRTPQAMYRAFDHPQYGRNAQLMGFINYVLSDAALEDALRRHDWLPAIRAYNGVGQEEIYMPLLENALKEIGQAIGLKGA